MNKKTAEFTFLGELRTKVIHINSGTELTTDAPLDNNGKGEAFSPTDLLAVAMITCMVTVMGIHADKKGWRMGEVEGWVEKIMISHPRRVGGLVMEITCKGHSLSKLERIQLQNIALNCPVAKSLDPAISTQVQFKYC